jgi:sterol 24-C-methyltransferase
MRFVDIHSNRSRFGGATLRLQRLRTRLEAFLHLLALDEATIEAFVRSRALFEGDRTSGNEESEAQVIDYYAVMNHLCALGNVEKMYIPPVRDPAAGVRQNQILFEQAMMRDIRVSPGARVLDIGCGRGRVASHVAVHAGAHVTGINIDPGQLDNARAFARRSGLAGRCAFVRGSLNDPLPFADGFFDAAYQIQAFTYARDKDAVFRDLFRVLRPRARFSYLDWVLLPAYDPENQEHVDLVRRTRPYIGAIDTPAVAEVEASMTKAGFSIVRSVNANVAGPQTGLIDSERRHFAWLRKLVALGVRSGLVPRHVPLLLNHLKRDAEAFVRADAMGLATTCYQIVCEKPG